MADWRLIEKSLQEVDREIVVAIGQVRFYQFIGYHRLCFNNERQYEISQLEYGFV